MERIVKIHILTIEKHLMKKLCYVLIFLLGIAALAFVNQTPALAQDKSIEVKCTDTSNNPVSGVHVQAIRIQSAQGTEKPKDKKSNNAGVAIFDKLDDGIYRIVGRKDGLVPALYEFVQTGASQQSVTLRLEAGDSAKKLYFEDPSIMQQAATLLNAGTDAVRAQKYADAEKALRESLALNPSNPVTYFTLGLVMVQKGDTASAEEPFKKASVLAGFMSTVFKGTADESQYTGIKQSSDNNLKLLPIIKLQAEGQKALTDKNYPLAITKFNEAIKANPNIPDTFYNLAVAYAQNKNYNDALGAVDQAIKLSPNEKDYSSLKSKLTLFKAQEYMDAANTQRKDKDNEGALKNYQEALSILTEAKSKAVVYSNMGVVQTELGRYDAAAESLKKAIESDPDKAEYRTLLANCYLKLKNYDEMFNVLLDPKTAGGRPADQVLLELGKKASNQADENSGEIAQLAFEKAISTNPENAEALFELGKTLYISKKDDKRAIELLEKYTKIGKNQANVGSASDMVTVIKRRLPK
jgi:tetratricopeptide (TPR) repeat protein